MVLTPQNCLLCCRFYITPKTYLGLIGLYGSLLSAKRAELGGARERLLNGLQRLHETNQAVDKMQAQLNALAPQLAEKTAATAILLEQVGGSEQLLHHATSSLHEFGMGF